MGVPSHVVLPVPDSTIAAIDQKHFLGLMAVIATQVPIGTTAVHIFSTGSVDPSHISDSGNNVLVAGDTEVQGNEWVEGYLRVFNNIIANSSLLVLDRSVLGGALYLSVTDVTTTPYSIGTKDHTLTVDTDLQPITILLPELASGNQNRYFRIINVGTSGNDITITPFGTDDLTGFNASRTLSDRSRLILAGTTKGWW